MPPSKPACLPAAGRGASALHRRAALLVLLLVPMLVSSAAADPQPALGVTVRPLFPHGRSNAPLPLLVEFAAADATPSCTLEASLREGEREVWRYDSSPLAPGPAAASSRRLLLLPVIPPDLAQPARITLRLRRGGQAVDLPPLPLPAAQAEQRHLSVAVITEGPAESLLIEQLQQRLALESYAPPPGHPPLVTSFAALPPDLLPDSAAAYCICDVVVIHHGLLAVLRQEQRQALTSWVRGGGSLCVLRRADWPSGLPADLRAELPSTQPAGDTVEDFVRSWSRGQGAVAEVAWPLPQEQWQSPAWRQALARLWHLRLDQTQTLVATGYWAPPGMIPPGRSATPALIATALEQQQQRAIHFPAAPERLSSASELLRGLLPNQATPVPLAVVAALLLLLLLLIVPADFLLLGLLRRRRWTWLALPLCCLLCTLLMLVAARSSLGEMDRRQRLEIVDLDEQGRVCRQATYELNFAAWPRNLQQEPGTALWTRLDQRRLLAPGASGASRNPAPTAEYRGALTQHGSITQRLEQWAPQLSRSDHFPATAAPPSAHLLRWDRLEPADLATIGGRARNVERLLDGQTFTGSMFVLHGYDKYAVRGRLSPFVPPTPGVKPHKVPEQLRSAPRDFLSDLCLRSQRGFFQLVQRVAPGGGEDFEDLACLDPSDEHAWLWLVVFSDAHGKVIYRMPLHGPAQSAVEAAGSQPATRPNINAAAPAAEDETWPAAFEPED